MNVACLNMSHGTHQWHKGIIKHIKTINTKTGSSVAILLDTKGPKVRTGDEREILFCTRGTSLTLTIKRQAELEPYCVEINYDGFVTDVALVDIVLIDGGMLNLKVTNITETDIQCECLDDGVLQSRRHVNIRGKSAEAIPHLDEILAVADEIMIARENLGAELPYEEVPLLQEQIIRKCRIAGKSAIVATHMLEAMTVNPTPTRAEVTDITQAVLQGTDAIMLSGETATEKHPLKALEVMDVVTRRIERQNGAGYQSEGAGIR